MLLGLERFRATVECSDAVAMDDAAMAVYFSKPLLSTTRRRVDSRTGAVDIEAPVDGGGGVVAVHVSDTLPLVLQPGSEVADVGRILAHRNIKRGGGRVMGRDSVMTDAMAAAARVADVVWGDETLRADVEADRGVVTITGPSRHVVEVLTAHESAALAAAASGGKPPGAQHATSLPATPAGSEPADSDGVPKEDDAAEEAAASAATIPAAILELTGRDPAAMKRDHAAEVAHDREAMAGMQSVSPPGGAPPDASAVEPARPPPTLAGVPLCWGGAPRLPGAVEAAMIQCRAGCQRCATMSQLRYLGNTAEGVRIERGVSAESGGSVAAAAGVGGPSAGTSAPAPPPPRSGERHYSGSFVTVGVMNLGGADARFAHASDSMADVLMARKGGFLATVGLMLRYVGRHVEVSDERNSSLYTYEKARTVVVTPDPTQTTPAFQAANVDGEVLPGPGPFRIHTLPSFLTAYGQV